MKQHINETAVLNSQHLDDIQGALGTIKQNDTTRPRGLWARLRTLLAILGPGLIVMVGDNDAGGFSTYAQAGQNYGTTLLWVLALLIPVLYINQEMVLRLGAVTGVGHARLILERFGKFWGAFSIIDLFALNALTIVTEFIGITLAMQFLGVPKLYGVLASALLVMLAASTGSFRRFERFSLLLVLFSLLLIPVFILIHPPIEQITHDLFMPGIPQNGKAADIMLLIVAIVGTTIAPWQLFFQQSYVIDKRLTPRFIPYERADLWLGIVLVIIGAIAIIAISAALFAGTPAFGHFEDLGAVTRAIARQHGQLSGMLFAITLIDASLIGASAVSLSTAYALSDVLSVKHSLHRKPRDAKLFYAVYFALIVVAAAVVLIPGMPLGLLTNGVQTLAGILLPSATVFLLILCNDKEILGPWVNGNTGNIITAAIVATLVLLSIVLTSSMLWPDISGDAIGQILVGGGLIALIVVIVSQALRLRKEAEEGPDLRFCTMTQQEIALWRMPPLSRLAQPQLSVSNRIWMTVLRAYLLLAICMVVYKVIEVAFS